MNNALPQLTLDKTGQVLESNELAQKLLSLSAGASLGASGRLSEKFRTQLLELLASWPTLLSQTALEAPLSDGYRMKAIVRPLHGGQFELSLHEDAPQGYLLALLRFLELLHDGEGASLYPTEALEFLGEAARADRVYLFELEAGAAPLAQHKAEWCAPGVAPQYVDRPPRALDFRRLLPDCYEALRKGQTVSRLASEFEGADRAFLESQSIRALLLIPVFVDGRLHAFIGFDQCRVPELWGVAETRMLQTAAYAYSLFVQSRLREMAKERAGERLKHILELLPNGFMVLKPSGRILNLNRQALLLLGLEAKEQALEKSLADLLPASQGPHLLRCLAELESQGSLANERFHFQSEGAAVALELSLTYFEEERGRERLILGTLVDATLQARHEERLNQARRMAERANQAKSDFLANISHEIRTSLNSILGFAQIMKMESSPSWPHLHHLESIDAAGQALLSLVNDMLDLSKIEAGKTDMKPEWFELEGLLREVGRVFEPRAREKGLRLELRMPAKGPGQVLLDPARMRQVLYNLVSNAVKFTESGSVEIAARVEPLEAGHALLRLSVRDTGPGLDAADLESIFEPFEQRQPRGSSPQGGTGLGLSISRRLVELMGGRLWASSVVGKGAEFSLELERVRVGDAPREEGGAPPEQEPKLAPARILVVDDMAINREIVRGLLAHLPYQIEEAEDGQRALEALERGSFDLVLLDMEMPVLNGKETAQAIRDRLGRKAPPVLVLSAHALDLHRAQMNGLCVGYLTKPVVKQKLIESIAAAIGSKEAPVVPVAWPLVPQELREAFRRSVGPTLDEIGKQTSVDLLHKFVQDSQAFALAHGLKSLEDSASRWKMELERFDFEKILQHLKRVREFLAD